MLVLSPVENQIIEVGDARVWWYKHKGKPRICFDSPKSTKITLTKNKYNNRTKLIEGKKEENANK